MGHTKTRLPTPAGENTPAERKPYACRLPDGLF